MDEQLSIVDINKDTRKDFGSQGEELAAEYLKQNGYRLVLSNFKVPVGRNSKGVQFTGEIDIVALERDVLCFVEVKTKHSDDFAAPIATVDLRKQRQITRAARLYRKIFNIRELKQRFDVVSIVFAENKAPKVELARGYWSEEKFHKRVWADSFDEFNRRR